jgi:hypothetical protein
MGSYKNNHTTLPALLSLEKLDKHLVDSLDRRLHFLVGRRRETETEEAKVLGTFVRDARLGIKEVSRRDEDLLRELN